MKQAGKPGTAPPGPPPDKPGAGPSGILIPENDSGSNHVCMHATSFHREARYPSGKGPIRALSPIRAQYLQSHHGHTP